MALVSLWACRGPEAPGGAADAIAGERIELRERDGFYLARPGGLAIGDDGTLYVADFFQKRVQSYRPDGTPVRAYGKPGSGPGEFQGLGAALVVSDSIVGALENGLRTFYFFGRESGAVLASRRVEGLVTSVAVDGPHAWLGQIDAGRQLAFGVWNVSADSLLASRPTEVVSANRVRLPADYVRSDILRGVYGMAFAAPWADSALVGFAGDPFLYVVDGAGTVVDSVRVPARYRRGIPDDFVRRLHQQPIDMRRIFSSASGLFGLARAASGDFVAVHMDPVMKGPGRITGRVFVTLLSADRTRACVDREIPVSEVSQPVLALRGDTLHVVEQHLDGENATTTLTRYPVSPRGCDWVPVEREGSR